MFSNLSIRLKLVVLLGISAALALFISSILTLYLTFATGKQESLAGLKQLADVSSENLRAAVAFHDDASAERMLASLRANPRILLADLTDENGRPFSRYVADPVPREVVDRYLAGIQVAVRARRNMDSADPVALRGITWEYMYVVEPVMFEGKAIGSLTVVSDTQALRNRIVQYLGLQFLISMVTLMILVAISIPLQKLFTRPIYALLDAMRQVSRTKEYGLEVPANRHDEFNDLYQGFNAMLAEIRERDEKLSHMATTDALTGLANRHHAMEVMETLVARARRKGEPLGVIALDIDHFKNINDTFGHPAGDRVLQDIARLLSGCARRYDLVARVGGEEFLILCDGSDLAATVRLAERIRQQVRECEIEYEVGKPIQVTVSLGVHAEVPDDDTGEHLLKTADTALYRAKNAGRDRVETGIIEA